MRIKKVRCPTCKKIYKWDEDASWRPFCSERCRLIDLGEWLDEDHRIVDSLAGTPYLSPEEGELQ